MSDDRRASAPAVGSREYVCPECGYDGFKASAPKLSGVTDAAMTWFCPRCATVDDRFVVLIETTDPRSVA